MIIYIYYIIYYIMIIIYIATHVCRRPKLAEVMRRLTPVFNLKADWNFEADCFLINPDAFLIIATGLSYSNLTTSAPRVASPNVSVDDTITVEVDVTNNAPAGQTAGGSRDATTVVQLYFQQQGGSAAVIRYYQQLVRYARVHVPAGAKTG
eukprot:COSAG06_NODE_14009_length_1198_cov_0.911738_1_plen_151_part_00